MGKRIGCRAVGEDGVEESVGLLLVGILEELGTESALLGCQLYQLAVIGCDVVVLGQKGGNATSAATELAPNVDDNLFHNIFFFGVQESGVQEFRQYLRLTINDND